MSLNPSTMSNFNKTTLKHRSKAKTLRELQYAIERLEKSGEAISISAVARGADVTPALIHNTYPDVAEQIRQLMGKATRVQRDAQFEKTKRQGQINKELRDEIAKLNADYADLASVNLKLQIELDLLKAVRASNVINLASAKT